MDPSDIDDLLDTRMVFKYQGNQPVAQFSKKTHFTFQSALHIGESELELSFFVPDHLLENREISILLAQNNAMKQGDLYFVTNNISTPGLVDSIRVVLENSVSGVLDNLYLKDGTYYLSIRFSNSEIEHFSRSILEFTKQFDNLGIAFLGPSPGLDSVLSECNLRTRLARMIWEFDMPSGSFSTTPLNELGREWVSEVRYMTKNDVVPQIFKTLDPIEDPGKAGFNVISEKDHLYELTFSNRGAMMKEYHAKSYDRKIVRFSRHLHYRNEKLSVETVIPAVQSRDLLQVLAATSEKYPMYNLNLISIEDVEFS